MATGSILICSTRAQVLLRASQVSGATLHYFRLDPQRLTGLVVVSEQQSLAQASLRDATAVRVFQRDHPAAERFQAACALGHGTRHNAGGGSLLRLRLVECFLCAFAEELSNHPDSLESVSNAKGRLKALLDETPAAALLDLSFQHLVQEMRCTPRHLSRIFHEVVGMSFREKQAQVRLVRAQELLATTESKVLDVALESGYQSLSLFNLMFKKRFGLTPGEWRARQRTRPDSQIAKTRTPQLRLIAASA
jgi:AraC-like DNA-binding protein